ncbi:MAG: tetratricopeptide repeat protein [Deltaproteobacteria bacterium]|nr:tetratricopeptide repeat protein [Deltaproteobacteria bacterium]MBW2360960.1 tetratricopeptide repeat protein [Deltaproteobacteria bacterium]
MHFGPCARLWLAPLVLAWALAPTAQASVQSEIAFHRGVIAYGEERWDEAKQQFERVLVEDSEDATALKYLALIAQAQDDPALALGYYDRALAIDPEDAALVLDRGTLLLDTGQIAEARQAFDRAIELEPDNGKAQLLAGMAAYRAGDHEGAKPHLERAGELDPTLSDEARYYSGLSEAMLGNMQAAASAFDDAATQSPLSPLGQSAQSFQQRLEQPQEPARRWQASFAVGSEVDSNPLIIGKSTAEEGETDGRVVLRPSASYRFLDAEDFSVTAGYDGYLSVHFSRNKPNIQIHNPWLSGSYDVGPVRLGLRYDYSFTMVDTDDPLRHLHRITPSALVRQGDWGASLLYYQFNTQDFDGATDPKEAFDRDGERHVPGFTQFFFLPEPFTYVRLGVLGSFQDTDGTEFEHDGVEAQFGAGYDFDFGISLAWLYQYKYRDYDNTSVVSSPSFKSRQDDMHVVTAEFSKMLAEHWQVSVGMALTFNDSNVPFYDYTRHIGGAYVTYHF